MILQWAHLPDGSRVPGLYECWEPVHKASGCERCYDVFGREFPPHEEGYVEGAPVAKDPEPHAGLRDTGTPDLQGYVGTDGTTGEGQEHIVEGGRGGGETSVHMRMYSTPTGPGWLERVIADFNETRASDVFVINFGAHFHEWDDERFQRETSILLEEMATLGETATVIWREMSPIHFPAANGSYESFKESPPIPGNNTNCCFGTPPPVSERNVWVENYLNDNGLVDRVKLLKIYWMSTFRGSAHRSCHIGPPTTPESEPLAAESEAECTSYKKSELDCRHWSETGVVEEWNKLMLNHLCLE